MTDDFLELDSVYYGDMIDNADNEGMMKVDKFEDKVKQALGAVMKHAVEGHAFKSRAVGISSVSGYHNYCNNPDHALHILAEAGLRPVNDAQITRMLNEQASHAVKVK
jgi:hypothetical protein